MGSEQNVDTKEASLAVEFADLDRERALGEQIEWTAEFCEVPSAKEIPKLSERSSGPIRLPGGQTIYMPDLSRIGMHDRLNPHYYHELANYVFTSRLVRKSRFVVTNTGNTPANDVRLEICVPNGSGYGILRWSDIPDAPKRRESVLDKVTMEDLHIRPAFQRIGALDIEKTDHETKVEIDCGNLQPGRKVWTDEFHLAVIDSGEVKIQGHLYAANLSQPQSFTRSIDAQITRTSMTVDELTALDEPEDYDD
ncbi:Transcriptional regulator [Durusdinium trenchii]|uniref:Transcriptional regulator n=1 Tax=Durusdinium trenchii TaxID=1381693 RepID=A0ABP0RZV5_9DINO